MAFIIARDFRTISLFPGEPGYFTFSAHRADDAETLEPGFASRAYTLTIYSPDDALPAAFAGEFADNRFVFRLSGTFTRSLSGRSNLRFVLADRLSAGGEGITTSGTFVLGETLPDSPDFDSAPAARYITHIRRVNNPDTVAEAPVFKMVTVEYQPTIAAPVNASAPAITGTAQVGSTLTASTGSWSGSPAFAYQWLRGGSTISGATSSTYLLISSDSAASITVRVTGTNAGGSATSTSAAVVVATQPVLSALTLTSAAVIENSASGIVIGQIAGRANGSTLSMTYNVGDRFALSGLNVVTSTTPTDYEAATSHTVIVRETHPDASPSHRDTNLTITVTNAFEQPALSALSLASSNFAAGTAANINIVGATGGSVIALSPAVTGFTVNSSARTVSYDGSGAAGSRGLTLVETLDDSANSPRASTVNVTVAAAVEKFTSFGIIGDSITAAAMGPGGFALRLVDDRPSGTSGFMRAVPSRVAIYKETLQPANTPVFYVDGDGGNSLYSHLTEDQQTGATLLITQIGTNDMAAARTMPEFRADMARYKAYVNAKGMKLGFSLPPVVGPRDPGTFATLQQRISDLRAIIRDPAVHGAMCDYYDPSCEHPGFFDNALDCFDPGDDIHFNLFASNLVYQSKKRFLYSLLDESRANSTTIYNSEWPTNQTGLPANTSYDVRFYIGGIARAGAAIGVSVTGGATVRRSAQAFGTNITERLFNGDCLTLRVPVGAGGSMKSIDLTIGGVTKTLTFAAAVPSIYTATYDPAKKSNANAKLTNNNLTFAGSEFGSNYPVRGGGNTALTQPTGYVEFTLGGGRAVQYNNPSVGLASSTFDFSGVGSIGQSTGSFAFINQEAYYAGNGSGVYLPGANYANNETVGIFVHKASGKAWLRTPRGWFPNAPVVNADGSLNGSSGAGIATGLTSFTFAAGQSTDDTLTVNAGASPFFHGPPANGEPGWR